MNSIVVMPTLSRPEMLALSLEKLQCARKKPSRVSLFADTCTEERLGEIEYVRDTYYPEADLFLAKPHVSTPSGCWNILNALKYGFESEFDWVHLVEEDVLIRPDYFDWVHSQEGNFFACSGRYIQAHRSAYYTNPGAAFPKQSHQFVSRHVNDAFFADRRGYMASHFGEMDEASDLDDGLIRRVIRQVGGIVRYPETPKVSHIGFHYYDRLAIYKNAGRTIQEKIEILREMLTWVKSTDRYSKDFEPF